MIGQRRSLGNGSQVGEFQHQQFHAAALEMYPRLGRIAAPLASADYATAESLMDDLCADRELFAVARLAIFGDLAAAVVNVSAACGWPEHGARLLGRDASDQRGINFAEEARGPRLVALSIEFARQRVGQVQQPPGPRHPDV